MAQTTIKLGDTLQIVLRQILVGDSPFPVDDVKYRILYSGKDQATGDTLFERRDITTTAKSLGTPAEGIVAVPIYSGRNLPSARVSATVVDQSIDGQVTFTVAAGPTNTVRQEAYMSKASDPTGTMYRAAEGPDGYFASGVRLGSTQVPASDASLLLPEPVQDESATQGNNFIDNAAIPTAVLAGAGAGDLDNGDHEFAVVQVAAADSDVVRVVLFEVIVVDDTLGREITWPGSGFESLAIIEDIGP